MPSGYANPRHFQFAERLRRARKAARLLPAELARAAGLSKNMVSVLEDGPSLPKLNTVEKLARALALSPGWLSYGLGDPAAVRSDGPLLCEGLADRLRVARAEQGLSALGLANAAGLTDGAVRSVEGARQPSLATLEALATALGVSPAWLAYGEGPMQQPRRGARPAVAAP